MFLVEKMNRFVVIKKKCLFRNRKYPDKEDGTNNTCCVILGRQKSKFGTNFLHILTLPKFEK